MCEREIDDLSGAGGKRHWSVPVNVRGSNTSTVFRSHYEDINNTMLDSAYFSYSDHTSIEVTTE